MARRGPDRSGDRGSRRCEARTPPSPNTTDVAELVDWVRPFDRVTVFATYASLGLGTLERAHAAGLPGWDLIVVDEAHRTSGRIGKPWAVVHDNTRIPALRRLYMTATPRLWQLDEDAGRGAPPELVASMDDDPHSPFGSRAYTLPLSEAVDRGASVPRTGWCAWTSPTPGSRPRSSSAWRAGRTRSAGGPARHTPGRTAQASSEEGGFRRTLVFHHQVREAERSQPASLTSQRGCTPQTPELYPHTIRADWLCGEHKPLHRRRVLDEFAAETVPDGTVMEKSFLGSVKVLGEGSTPKCVTPCTGRTSAAPCPISCRPSAGRCGCSQARENSPRSWFRCSSGRARRSRTCSPVGRTAGSRSCWRR